jgi:hypothetical protein
MRRLPWMVLFALLAGFGFGLVYAWVISPLRVTDADPTALRADFKDGYRAAVAAAYVANGNLPRAQARLFLLQDSDPIEALNAQAQRMLASSDTADQANQLAALALALEKGAQSSPTSLPVTQTKVVNSNSTTSTATLPPPPPDLPIQLTETVTPLETQVTPLVSTPRPTRTVVPTLGPPFVLTGQEEICDPNLPDGLLQVVVLNSNRRQMPGMKIVITWDGGEEQFFTGLKPELGDGYADYLMSSDVTYSIQLAVGSEIANGISPSACQAPNGETFSGGMKLTFQQP